MRARAIATGLVLFSLLSVMSAVAQEQRKSEPRRAAMTMQECQDYCDIMSEPDLSNDEQKAIQYCVRNDFCNFVKADAPPLGLFQTNRKIANILKRRMKKNSTALFSAQNAN